MAPKKKATPRPRVPKRDNAQQSNEEESLAGRNSGRSQHVTDPNNNGKDPGSRLGISTDPHPEGGSQTDEEDEDVSAYEEDEDDDPVIAEYEVFVADELQDHLVVLIQYPNQEANESYTAKVHNKPLELRLKPQTGLVEVDVQMDVMNNFDKRKALTYGKALKQSELLKSGGSHGLAGGLSAIAGGGHPARRTVGASGDVSDIGPTPEEFLAHFDHALNTGNAMNKQVMGGQMERKDEEGPIYMIGSFRGKQLHLTRLDSIIQLRPQFHHLDALVEQERSSMRVQRDATNPRPQEARAVQMTVKSTAEVDDMDMTETAQILKARQEEEWQHYDYHHQETPAAWHVYDTKLFLRSLETAPKLKATIFEDAYLDMCSAPRIDPIQPLKSRSFAKKPGSGHDQSKSKKLVTRASGIDTINLMEA